MAYYKNPIIYPTGRISQDTAKINENFTELAKSFVNEDPTTYKVINADKVDDYHANQIPMPNTIPVSDNSGKLNLNWIPQGSGSGLNADQVDGFHASQTPSANTIPVAGADGKLNAGWLPVVGAFQNRVVFTSSGTWVVPSGVNVIYVIAWGGGGGGGGGHSGGASGGGGGGGFIISKLFQVTARETLTITIGAGGAGGVGGSVYGNPGGNGGTTSIVGSVSETIVSCSGGGGGAGGGSGGGVGGIYANLTLCPGLKGYDSSDSVGGRGMGNILIGVLGGAGGKPGQNAPPNSGAGGGGGSGGGGNMNGGAGGSGYVEIWY